MIPSHRRGDCAARHGWLVPPPSEGWGLSSDCGDEEQSCYKHPCLGFCANRRFHFSCVNIWGPVRLRLSPPVRLCMTSTSASLKGVAGENTASSAPGPCQRCWGDKSQSLRSGRTFAVTSASCHSGPFPSECQIIVLVSFPFISMDVKKCTRTLKGPGLAPNSPGKCS